MPTTGRTSDYDNELTSQPADDDLFDVSVLISTGPDVWQSQKMRYAEINFGVAISNDVIAIGNAAGDGARIALLNVDRRREANKIARKVEYIELALEEDFNDRFGEAMQFPHMFDKFPHMEHLLSQEGEVES